MGREIGCWKMMFTYSCMDPGDGLIPSCGDGEDVRGAGHFCESL